MKGLFSSQDSRYYLKTAFYITSVPVLMLSLVVYSIWLLLSMNYSYFVASGLPLDGSLDVFMDYLLQSQIDYLPLVGLFFIAVFFVGLFIAHIVLRPFNQLHDMCFEIKNAKGKRIKIVGIGKKKLLIKLGEFLCEYVDGFKNNKPVELPDSLKKVKGPTMDAVFYFQFICIFLILMSITVFSIYVFAQQLQDSVIQTAITTLKSPKGMTRFLISQKEVFDFIILVPSLVSCVLYGIISRLIIARIEGVTYAYVRDVREVANGNRQRRVLTRKEDPGTQAADSVNEVLDMIHPRPQSAREMPDLELIPVTNK